MHFVGTKIENEASEWNDEVAKEKDLLLERFAEWAEKICKKITENGYFADYMILVLACRRKGMAIKFMVKSMASNFCALQNK